MSIGTTEEHEFRTGQSTIYVSFILLTDVDVVELWAQADACMPASNNDVNHIIYYNF